MLSLLAHSFCLPPFLSLPPPLFLSVSHPLFFYVLPFNSRPAQTQALQALSPPSMSVPTRPLPPCSLEQSPLAPLPAWPLQGPPLSTSASPHMRSLMTCRCPPGGKWQRQPQDRDTSSSKCAVTWHPIVHILFVWTSNYAFHLLCVSGKDKHAFKNNNLRWCCIESSKVLYYGVKWQ